MRHVSIFSPSLFNICINWILGRVLDQSPRGSTLIIDLVFCRPCSSRSVVAALVIVVERHCKGGELFGTSGLISLEHGVFEGLLNEAIQSVYASGEYSDLWENLLYLNSALQNQVSLTKSCGRLPWLKVLWACSARVWHCRQLCKRTKIRIFKLAVLPILIYKCETMTLNSDEEVD